MPEGSRELRERRLVFPTSNRLETWLLPSRMNRSRQYYESTMVWHNLPPYHRFYYFVLSFLTKRAWQSGSKHLQRWYRVRLRQTMVDSWYFLDRFVPEGMSQVSRWSEVGNISTPVYLVALLWELSHVPRGLTENAEAKQVRKTNRTDILYQIEKKGSRNRSWRFGPKIFMISFSRSSGPPLNHFATLLR